MAPDITEALANAVATLKRTANPQTRDALQRWIDKLLDTANQLKR